MTDTPKPTTPTSALIRLWLACEDQHEHEDDYESLMAFLDSDLIQKLQDPKLRAALEVIVEGLPELFLLDGEWTVGESEHWQREVRLDGKGVYWCGSSDGINEAKRLLDALNLIHRAYLKAK